MLRTLTAIALSLAALGCVAVPLERAPSGTCGRRMLPCRNALVVGLFPGIGEAHMNDLATNGKPLTTGLFIMDYTLRPLFIAGINFLSLGFPTVASWLLEPYESYGPDSGACDSALIGYCKAGKMVIPPEPVPAPADDSAGRG